MTQGEIRKRRRRFVSLCMAFVMLVGLFSPITAEAANYPTGDGEENNGTLPQNSILSAGDTVTFKINSRDGNSLKVNYHDWSGSVISELSFNKTGSELD